MPRIQAQNVKHSNKWIQTSQPVMMKPQREVTRKEGWGGKSKNAGRMLEWTEKRVNDSGLVFVDMGGCRELQEIMFQSLN